MTDRDIIAFLWLIAQNEGKDIQKLGMKGLVEEWLDIRYEIEYLYDQATTHSWREENENVD